MSQQKKSSKYIGVRCSYTENKWEAFFHSWHIGYFIDEEKAAKTRDHYVKINVMAKQPMNFRMKV